MATAPGGTSDPMARNGQNVRSKPTVLPKYDPPQTIARDFAARAAVQVNNANRIETQTAAYGWACGQIDEWQAHVNRDQSIMEKIDFAGWLQGSARSFFDQLESERGIKTKAGIKSSDQRYKKVMEPGYQEPGPYINGEEDQEAVGGDSAPASLDPDERALRSFCARQSNLAAAEHAREQFGEFKAYKARFRDTALTFDLWLRHNPVPKKGMVR